MAAIPEVPIGARRNWLLPLFAAVCVIAATVVLADSLRLRERHHILHLTQMASATVTSDIEADLEARFLAPVRTTKLWDLPADVSQSEWDRQAHTFLSEHPNIFAAAWTTPDGRLWSVPEDFGPLMPAGVIPAPASQSALPPARDPRFASAFVDARGERFRRIIVPLSSATGRVSYGIVAFRGHEAMEDLLADVNTLGYAFDLTEGTREVFRHDPPGGAAPNAPTVTADVNAPGIHWIVRATASRIVMADLQSVLPQFVLVMGTLFSLLVGLSVYLAQSARSKAENLTREIAERQRYENALQASQARMNGIVQTSADGVIAVDDQQRITIFNKGAEGIFGYSADEVMGKPLDLLIPQRFHQGHRGSIEDFGREKAGPRRMAGPREVFGRKKDGTEFPIEASISRVDTAEGVTYTSIVRDVTERVRAREELQLAHQELERRVAERTAELASANESLLREIEEREAAESHLRESEQRLQGILDNCTACVFMKDIDGRYLLINRWYETLFNLSSEATIGKTDADIFPPQVAAELRENDRLVLRSQQPIEFEEHVAHPDGTIHTYIATKFLVHDGKGEPFAICGIATDITRQKQAEELLSELSGGLMALQDEERKRLSRELHEGTAQMLAAVQMNLELAKRFAREDSQKAVGALDISLDLVEQSASQLRTMAYLLHPPGLDDFGLAPALRWYANGFSTRSGISVQVKVQTKDDRFDHDVELAVFRIVQEALTNIVRHSESKTAEIILRQDDDDVEVEVHDTGRGIAPEIMSRMSSGRTVPGIGIAGIRERVRQLGGVFGMQSGDGGVRLIAKLPINRAGLRHSSAASASQHSL